MLFTFFEVQLFNLFGLFEFGDEKMISVSQFAGYLIFAGKVEDLSKVQTLLFSATLPSWVQSVCFYGIISFH